jgi:hypothetical protein
MTSLEMHLKQAASPKSSLLLALAGHSKAVVHSLSGFLDGTNYSSSSIEISRTFLLRCHLTPRADLSFETSESVAISALMRKEKRADRTRKVCHFPNSWKENKRAAMNIFLEVF